MGSLYRSEEMRFCQMIVEKDAAFACMAEIGKRPCVQFKDLNPEVNAFQRMFVRDIRRFDEMERKLRFLEAQVRKDLIPVVDETWRDDVKEGGPGHEPMSHQEVNDLEQTLIDLERDVISMQESDLQLKKNFLELKEWASVLEHTEEFFQGGIDDAAMAELEQAQETEAGFAMGRAEKEPMGYVVGVIAQSKVNAFERILWRACRRTAFVRHLPIEEELENPERPGEKLEESVFIVFYNGERLRNIIDKVSEGFRAKQYNQCPKTSTERRAAAQKVQANIADMETVMNRTKDHRLRVLNAAAVNIRAWLKQVRIHKSIYHTLNLFTFDGIGKFFVAECWIPLRDIESVRAALEDGVKKNGGTVKPVLNVLHTDEQPPTYNRVNKFTEVFQSIVDSYGIASYLEVNPAPYTIITFPFIFSCMFGDMGHGLLMFLSALYLVMRERNLQARQIRDEIFGMFFGGRYVILLMGLFSIHAGLIYNDAFSKAFNALGSSWRNPYSPGTLRSWIDGGGGGHGHEIKIEVPSEFSYMHSEGPYPLGVDPVWNLAENRLSFLNSMKMKLSVIVGIAQMTFGVFLSLQNYRFFKSPIEIYTVFIPQLLFMSCIFVYLCLQIVVKWLVFWVVEDTVFGRIYPGSHCAPSLLIGLIAMFMFKSRPEGFIQPGQPAISSNHTAYKEVESCFQTQWYPGQSGVEAFLVTIALLCVPVMLFGKPLYILMEQRRARRAIGDSMSVRMNMQTDEMEVLKNGRNNVMTGGDINARPGADDAGHTDTDGMETRTTLVTSSLVNQGDVANAVLHHNSVAKEAEAHGGGGGGGHHGESFGDIMVHQSIHTIEYVLGCVSHTASYLRLWALSLAHAQLSEVLWTMVFANGLKMSGSLVGGIAIYFVFFFFGVMTFCILVLMEGLSAFLHALRLHWVEFQSKFYAGLGYAFTPYSFQNVLELARATDTPT